MGLLTLVTGGARSGKSSFSEDLIGKEGNSIVYIATAIAFDKEMEDRIKKHRESRPSEWFTIERYKDFREISNLEAFVKADSVILDCLTIMVTNLLIEYRYDFDNISMEEITGIEKDIFKQVSELLDVIKDKNVVIVTNEIGMGIVPNNVLSRVFRDIAGRVNQYIAKRADRVYFLVSGIPMEIKK
jgi:adenosylcobinamide kinase/adenosylcobinamide-phosphate guanylyltransferase